MFKVLECLAYMDIPFFSCVLVVLKSLSKCNELTFLYGFPSILARSM